MTKTVLLLHGLESSPGGLKAEAIEAAGYRLVNPALPKESWEDSLAITQRCVDEYEPDIIVGSSRGGALALNVDPGLAKLVLIAPAWARFGKQDFDDLTGTTVLHSPADDIVYFADSLRLARDTGCSLLEVGTDHRMNTEDVLTAMIAAVSGV